MSNKTEHHHHHHHSHHHDHNHNHLNVKNIKAAFFLNIFFTIIEIVGGILTNSIAIISDAIHDLGDSLSLGLAWYFQKLSGKSSDASFSYGYKRFSLLGAIINSLVLTAGSIIILTKAIPRIFHPEQPEVHGMILLAILGIAANGMAVFRLKKGSSLNERVVSLHLLEDVLGWLAILIGSIVMKYVNVPVLDPIMSVMITIYILYNVYNNIRQSMKIILQGTPEEINSEIIENELKKFDRIDGVHDLHIWSIDGSYNILTVHIVLKEQLSYDEITDLKSHIRTTLENNGIQHVTLEFETSGEECNYEYCKE